MDTESNKNFLPGSRVLDRTKNIITTVVGIDENSVDSGGATCVLVEGSGEGERRSVPQEYLKPLNGMNEAFFITEPLMGKIEGILDIFRKNIISRFVNTPFNIDSDYSVDGQVTFKWDWDAFEMHGVKPIHRSPTTKTEDDFLCEIKAYLFDLITATVLMKKYGKNKKFE